MPLFDSRDALEYKRAIQKWNEKSSRLFTLDGNNNILKEGFDEDAHPRDEHGRFVSGGGGGGSSDSESEKTESVSDNSRSTASNFSNAAPKEFTAAAQAAKAAQAKEHPENAWRVTTMSEEEFEKEHPGSLCHITPGGSVAAVTPDGDIVSVCGMPGDTIKGSELIAQAVAAGGTKLDSYEGNHGFYLNCGFEPVSWCKWDDAFAPEGWEENRDKREDIVFYKYTGSQEKYSREEGEQHLKEFKEKTPASIDYEKAKNIRDESL